MNKKNILRIFLGTITFLALLVGVVSVVRSQDGRRGRGGFGGPLLPSETIGTALPQVAADPSSNPTTPAKVALGKLLFWDPILSGDKDIACATCHHPDFGYAENLDISIGVNGIGLGKERRRGPSSQAIPLVRRNSQTLLNTAFNGIDQQGHYDPSTAPMFWDMRAQSLEAQALVPIKTLEEMRGTSYSEEQALDMVTARLKAVPEYRTLFTKAFGGADSVTGSNLGKALATFERSLLANHAPFDRYMRGETNAMTEAQIRGMQQFESVGCTNCHSGPMFSDYKPHVLSIPDNPKLPVPDQGVNQNYAFRTASLRNLAYTAPYMHSGVFPTLEDVLNFYNQVQRRPRNPNVGRDQIDPLLRRLRNVNRSASDIIEFLNALNDPSFDKTIPARVPSGLNPGGHIE
jgi:cytochrome c peroxidase